MKEELDIFKAENKEILDILDRLVNFTDYASLSAAVHDAKEALKKARGGGMKQKAYIEITVDKSKEKDIEFRLIHDENLKDVEFINMDNFPAILIAHHIIVDLQERFGEKVQPDLFEQIQRS